MLTGRRASGARVLCAALEDLGATHVFGLPGTQNVARASSPARSALGPALAGRIERRLRG